MTVANTSDVAESAQALLSRQIDLYFAIGDNTAYNALPLVIRYCTDRGIPLLAEDISLMGSGALMSFAPGLYSDGKQTAEMVCRVLLGESPKDMPIAQSQKNEITVDLAAAKALNVPFPQDILTRCDRYFHAGKAHGAPHRIALVSLVENSSLDLAVKGVEEGLQTMGFAANNDYVIASYNAQGEIAQLPQIMDAALSDDPDLIVTVTTPALMAALKKVKEIPLVFTVASDPEKLHLFDHGRPENVCGVHDDPPVNALVEMALRHNPELKILGTVYDPSQMNAVLSVEKLRAVAETHGLSLVEATASMLSELPMAVQSLQQKGAQALVISADNLTTTGFPALRRAAGHMPIFTTEPRLSTLGATGCIGDDYLDWGRQSGILAARILAGVPPSQLKIGPTQKTVVIEPEAVQAAAEPTVLPKQKIRLVLYNQTAFAEESARGLLDGLKKAGFEEGREYELIEYNANGDVATLASIMTAVAADKVDMLLVVTTPVLQSALRLAGEDTRIVFTGVASGVLAGAGEDQTNHLARVTGVTTRSPFEGMAQLIHETRPDICALGTLFTPAEVNSVLYKEYLESALKPYNIALFAVPVTSSSETSMAMDALCRNPVQGICQIMDNTTRPGFQHIARKAADNDLPVYIFESASIKKGATLALARDFYDAGLEAAGLAVRILRGESPAGIPFRNTQSETCTLNSELVKRYQLHISPELERRAEIHRPDRKNDDALE
ncbi:MAG: hypothetical protein EOL87_02340 [Spartobacteria bacterium]|nr:hypothetical protein [Spartobacteria bacterium]